MEHFLYAPSHLILTIPHYIGTIIPLNSQMRKLRLKKLGNMAKVSALLRGGTWVGSDPAGWLRSPCLSSPLQPSQGSPRGHGGVTGSPPSHFQRLHDSPVRRSYEGISLLQSFQILGRHTEVSCKARISDRGLDGHSSAQGPGVWTHRLRSKSTNRCHFLSSKLGIIKK